MTRQQLSTKKTYKNGFGHEVYKFKKSDNIGYPVQAFFKTENEKYSQFYTEKGFFWEDERPDINNLVLRVN